jgi:hypothetical protein
MTRAPWLLLPLVALLLLAVPRAGEGTSVKRLAQSDLVRDAQRIVHADCLDCAPEYDATSRRIFTRVRFAVRETLKGKASSTIELLIPGGQIGTVATVVHGMPAFKAGEEVVLYATGRHPKSKVCLPVGLDQGCYRIKRPRNTRATARRDTRELLLVEPGKKPARGRTETLPLEDLLKRVRAEVSKQAKAKKKQAKKQQIKAPR